MRKIFTTLLFLVSIVLSNSGLAKAQSGEGWSLEGEVLTITSNTPKLEVDPQEYPGQSWYDLYADQVTTLVFGDGVTVISDDLVSGNVTVFGRHFSNLTTVSIGKNVEKIGVLENATGSSGVFSWCNKLTTVEFQTPSKLKTINASSFFNALGLQSISLPSTVEEIGDEAFGQCQGLKTINLNETALRRLGKRAFMSCSNLTNIKLPATVETIGDYAFSGCAVLESVTIEENEGDFPVLQTIGQGAFFSCDLIETVPLIPSAQTELGYGTFYGCKNLRSIQFASNSQLEKIADADQNYGAFAYSGIEHITLPKSIKYIGAQAFEFCESLISVDFEEESVLEDIADKAFWRSGLQEIILPETVKTIGEVAFSETQVKAIQFPDNITVIEKQAFAFTLLENIDVPSSLITLGSGAFQNCENLITATFRGSDAPARTGAIFGSCKNLTDIYVPVGAEGYKDTFLEYQDKLRFTLPSEDTGDICEFDGNADYHLAYDVEKGWSYEKEDGTVVYFSGKVTGSTTGNLTVNIPEGVCTLVFQDCSLSTLIVEGKDGTLWVDGDVVANEVIGNIHLIEDGFIQAPEGQGIVTLKEPEEGGSYTAFVFGQMFENGQRLPIGSYVSFSIKPEEGYVLDTAMFGTKSMKDTYWEGLVNYTITKDDSDLTVTITFKKEEVALDLKEVKDTVRITYENNNWYYQETGKEKVAFDGSITGANDEIVLLAENIPADAPTLQFAEGSGVGSLVVFEGSSLRVEGRVTVGSVSGNITASETATIAPSENVVPVEIPDEEPTGGSYAVTAFGQSVENNTQLPAGTVLSFEITIEDGYELASATIGGNSLVEELSPLRTKAVSTTVNRYYEITGKETDLTVKVSFREKITDPDTDPDPGTDPDPDPTPDPDPDPTPTPDPEPTINLTLPAIEGATTTPAAGTYEIEEGEGFSFVIVLDEDYDQSKPIVKVNGKVLEPDADGVYQLTRLSDDVTITIEGIVKNEEDPTSISGAEDNVTKVWASHGYLHIQSYEAGTAYIISTNGKLHKILTLPEGETVTAMPQGVYIVRIGGQSYKLRF